MSLDDVLVGFDPVVILAREGFWVGSFVEPEGGITDDTKPEDLDPYLDPIIAWLVRPALAHPKGRRDWWSEELCSPEVRPVTPEGFPPNDTFVVDERGQWNDVGNTMHLTMESARVDWLEHRRAQLGEWKRRKEAAEVSA